MVWIDNKLLKIAEWMILVAGFFGISRWRLIVGWIIMTSIIFHLSPDPKLIWKDFQVTLLLSFVLPIVVWIPQAGRMYREDDVVSNHSMLTRRYERLILTAIWIIIGYTVPLSEWRGHRSFSWILVAKFPPVYFYYWIILNQNTKSKVTLRGLVKTFVRRVSEMFQPQTAPVPVPARFFTPPS